MAASTARPAVSRVAVLTTDESSFPGIDAAFGPVFDTVVTASASEINEAAAVGLDAVVLDMECGGQNTTSGLNTLQFLRSLSDRLIIFAISRNQAPNLPKRVREYGADDFFFAPVDFEEIRVILQRFLQQRLQEEEDRRLQEQLAKNSFCDIVGGSAPMRLLYEAIARVAETNSTVLIRGESGTGKELVARAIVRNSRRAEKPFVSLNCAALPENLIEAELFGHEKGA